MRTEEFRRGLAEIAGEQPAPGSVESVIARGARRLRRRRLGVGAGVLALVVASAGVIVATRHDARRGLVVSPPPTSVALPVPGPTKPANEIIFTSATEGWLCGDPILHTADGGEHWQAQSFSVLASGTHTCAAVPTEAWIFVQSPSGDIKVLPAQGGANIAVTIEFPKVPAGARVTQATFVDREHGWVLLHPDGRYGQSRGFLYRTTTGMGPVDFTLVSSAAPNDQVEFVNPDDGWGIDGGSFVRTNDGGRTWDAVAAPTLPSTPDGRSTLARVAVHGSTIVVAGVDADASGGSARSFFVVSRDSGNTWTRRDGPAVGAEFAEPTSLKVIDASTWVFRFGDRLWATGDSGRTWTESPPPALPPNTVSIAYPTLEENWALDASGTLFQWSDGGPKWARVDTTAQPPWSSKLVSLPGDSVGCPEIAPPTTIDRATSDSDAAVAAAREFVRATRGWTGEQVEAVYPVTQPGGQFGEIFAQTVPRQCGQAVADASWGVELGNPSVTQDSSRTTALVVAPTVDGLRVWGFYR
jgi:photosystem II stability/assembly factor-like uncharacterized protein